MLTDGEVCVTTWQTFLCVPQTIKEVNVVRSYSGVLARPSAEYRLRNAPRLNCVVTPRYALLCCLYCHTQCILVLYVLQCRLYEMVYVLRLRHVRVTIVAVETQQ
jgi:hypothetical protein